MKLKSMLKKKKYGSPIKEATLPNGPKVPDGILKKCKECKSAIFTDEVVDHYYICPKCGNYFRVHAMHRIEMITDPGTFEPWDEEMAFENPTGYPAYEDKIRLIQQKTGLKEAVVTGKATIGGYPTTIAVMDNRFIMGSMGKVVGEKITRMVERSTKEKLPVIIFATSGGARMQEGIHSLMQMAKTAAALKRHSESGGFFISVLTNPTTGGVTASFAMLGDVILAEPGALIGFAGPRVIEQTIGEKLPRGFQSSEFLLEHGFVDRIVERKDLKQELKNLLKLHTKKQISFLEVENKAIGFQKSTMDAWERVKRSRKKERPSGKDYINTMFPDFIEFHGDRYFGDDKAIVAGIASFLGRPITVIAQEKGRNTKESMACNFGMASPEGYRKALRMMKQAEKFQRPIVCFVDTKGAFCGIEAEKRGQGRAIALNLSEMSALKVPVLSIVIGEGGSGGALALATANEVWMLENSTYSILSPEGFASILWKDSTKAKEAAERMKLTAWELEEAGVIDKVIEEPENLTAETFLPLCQTLTSCINEFLVKYERKTKEEIAELRYRRFRNM